MKICFLSSPGWHFLDLKRAARDDHALECYSYEELTATVKSLPATVDSLPATVERLSETSGRSIPLEYDVILTRTMPAGSLQQVVFRMDVLLELERSGVKIVNPPRCIETAVDKYLALTRLVADGIPIPDTAVSQTTSQAQDHFHSLGGDVVVKPLFGSMGRGLIRIQAAEEAAGLYQRLVSEGQVIYQQRFVEHGGFDLRLLVIGDRVLAMKRVNPNHWITNIAQGGTGIPHAPTQTEIGLALGSARSVGAVIAGVDLLYDERTGCPCVIEVNSSPSWRATGEVLGVDIAKMILDELSGLCS